MTEFLSNPEPLFRIDGEPVGLSRDTVRVEVEEGTDGLKTLCVHLSAQGPEGEGDRGLLYLSGGEVDFGKTVEVTLGGGDDARTVFKGRVSGIEASFEEGTEPQVVLFAEDDLMKLRMTRRSKTYQNKSDAQIAEELARLNGLTPDATAEGPTYDYVQQWNQSDLAFLRARARLINAELWVRDGTLYFKSRAQRAAPALTLVNGSDLVQVQLRADLAHQRTRVTASGYDVSARDLLERASGQDAVQSEISGGRTGPSILAQDGARESFRVRDNPLLAAEAQAFAQAEMLRRARAFVVAVGVTTGHPDLEVGSTVNLDGVGRPFTGDGYYVTRVRHAWDRSRGFRTHFEAERPTLNEVA